MKKVKRLGKSNQVPSPVPFLTSESHHKTVGVEIGLKLFFNVVISSLAIAALVKLVPYYFSQKANLGELRNELQDTERRVNKLRDNFSGNFTPHANKSTLSSFSPRVAPNQVRIFLTEKNQEIKQLI